MTTKQQLLCRVFAFLRREARPLPPSVYAVCLTLAGVDRMTQLELADALDWPESSVRFALSQANCRGLVLLRGRVVLDKVRRGGLAYAWGLSMDGRLLVRDVVNEIFAEGEGLTGE